jgi:hypothetical protein
VRPRLLRCVQRSMAPFNEAVAAAAIQNTKRLMSETTDLAGNPSTGRPSPAQLAQQRADAAAEIERLRVSSLHDASQAQANGCKSLSLSQHNIHYITLHYITLHYITLHHAVPAARGELLAPQRGNAPNRKGQRRKRVRPSRELVRGRTPPWQER